MNFLLSMSNSHGGVEISADNEVSAITKLCQQYGLDTHSISFNNSTKEWYIGTTKINIEQM